MTYEIVWNGCRNHPGGPYLFARRRSGSEEERKDYARSDHPSVLVNLTHAATKAASK